MFRVISMGSEGNEKLPWCWGNKVWLNLANTLQFIKIYVLPLTVKDISRIHKEVYHLYQRQFATLTFDLCPWIYKQLGHYHYNCEFQISGQYLPYILKYRARTIHTKSSPHGNASKFDNVIDKNGVTILKWTKLLVFDDVKYSTQGTITFNVIAKFVKIRPVLFKLSHSYHLYGGQGTTGGGRCSASTWNHSIPDPSDAGNIMLPYHVWDICWNVQLAIVKQCLITWLQQINWTNYLIYMSWGQYVLH